jgi:hypothetical protein
MPMSSDTLGRLRLLAAFFDGLTSHAALSNDPSLGKFEGCNGQVDAGSVRSIATMG